MQILSPSATGAVLLLLSGLACHAQNPQTPPSAQLPGPTTSPIPDGPPLETRVFEIWPDFLSKGSGQSDPNDPFVADSPPAKPTFKVVLEQLGIEFTTPGSKVIRGPGRNEITVTNTKEQLHNTETVLYQKFGQGPPRQGQVHLEVFSMPPLVARKSLLAHPKESDLYTWIEAELAKPDSSVKLERHSITIVRGGQKAKNEGINEIPHPTEFDPPAIPQNVSLPVAATSTTTPTNNATYAPWPRTEPKPDSIEFRNAGDTFEVELTFGDDGKTVDLNLAPGTSRRVGIAKSGLQEDVYQPIYETQKCTAQASGLIGQPMLISTFSPPVNTSVPGGNEVDRTWLLFVTVKQPE